MCLSLFAFLKIFNLNIKITMEVINIKLTRVILICYIEQNKISFGCFFGVKISPFDPFGNHDTIMFYYLKLYFIIG